MFSRRAYRAVCALSGAAATFALSSFGRSSCTPDAAAAGSRAAAPLSPWPACSSSERGRGSCEATPPPTQASILDSIGNTPLLELTSLSRATGCRILAKAEFMNPGGSVKDRPALALVLEAERAGLLKPGGCVVEGTGGNTGVGLALVCAARGYRCICTCPDNTSPDKIGLIAALGAKIIVCAPAPFESPAHYYQRARAIAASEPGGVWGNQFESTANARSHYEGTGPELWAQSGERVDALALAAGTGGTIAGVSMFLRERNPALKVFLIDPPGSTLLALVRRGIVEASPGSTAIMEGVGIGRKTANFALARVDAAFEGSDQEALDMAYFLLRNEGVFVGPSAALNVVAAVKAARVMGPGKTIATVLCDGGDRYRSKLYSPAWLAERGLRISDIASSAAKERLTFVT